MLKKFLSLALVFALLLSSVAASWPSETDYSRQFQTRRSAWSTHEPHAQALDALGLFLGSDAGYELEREATRIEALVTVIRLTGGEAQALETTAASGFTDVAPWAEPYAAYGRTQGLVQGVSADTMAAGDPITTQQYLTMLLRVLGYDDSAGDFSYTEALSFAQEAGLLESGAARHYSATDALTRDDIVYLMYCALKSDTTDDAPLLYELVERGAVSREDAYGLMDEKNESEAEILRATRNGYQNAWVVDLQQRIADNRGITAMYQEVFQDCIYNWLKEAGMGDSIAAMGRSIDALTAEIRRSTADSVFRSSANTVAYFRYPSTIVVRHDLNLGSERSSVAHEFRHAMSVNISITLLEEGITEVWNQEVDGGFYGYPYYYLNVVKLILLMAGAEEVNAADLRGDYEEIFFLLEENTGVPIDRLAFYKELSDLTQDTDLTEHLAAVNTRLLTLLEGYYNTQWETLCTADREYFVDALLAAGQLLCYPSTMIQYTESNVVSGAPSDYYSDDFLALAHTLLEDYAAENGAPLTALTNYFNNRLDTRLSFRFFGEGAGTLYVKGATAYQVYFQYDRAVDSKTFGRLEDAQAFATLVKVTQQREVSGEGFTPRDGT